MVNPIAFETYLGILIISLQKKVKPKSTSTPETPTTPNLRNLKIRVLLMILKNIKRKIAPAKL